MLNVYAFLGRPPSRLPHAPGRTSLRVVACGSVWVALGDTESVPAPEPEALRRHDAVVRSLAQSSDAILPARFGSVVDDESELRRLVEPRGAELGAWLELVAGREQMTLRVYAREQAPTPTAAQATAAAPDTGGPGTRYLTARRRAGELPQIEPLRAALAPLIVAERIERHRTAPLLASVYHLCPRGESALYRTSVRRVSAGLAVRLRISGPWPPYAFAAGALP